MSESSTLKNLRNGFSKVWQESRLKRPPIFQIVAALTMRSIGQSKNLLAKTIGYIFIITSVLMIQKYFLMRYDFSFLPEAVVILALITFLWVLAVLQVRATKDEP